MTMAKSAKPYKPTGCPYCDMGTELVGGDVIYPHRPDLAAKKFWRCSRGDCDAYVGCHPGTTDALGRLADAELRRAKNYVHRVFDPLWRDGPMSRGQAYRWLAGDLGIDVDRCHVGMFNVDQCRDAYRAVKQRQIRAA